MTRAEQYRAYALETEALAHRTADRGARATLQGVAMQWRKMAEQVERHPLDSESHRTHDRDAHHVVRCPYQ